MENRKAVSVPSPIILPPPPPRFRRFRRNILPTPWVSLLSTLLITIGDRHTISPPPVDGQPHATGPLLRSWLPRLQRNRFPCRRLRLRTAPARRRPRPAPPPIPRVETTPQPTLLEAPPPPVPASSPPAPSPRFQWTFRNVRGAIWYGIKTAVSTLFGIASLIFLLAVVAAIPGANFYALGYLLEVEGRVARSGRFRDAFPLLDLAPKLGAIALGICCG